MIRAKSKKLEEVTTKDMSKEEMLCMIRANKHLKSNLAGYSAMKKDELKMGLEKALKGETVKPRKKPTTKWNEALKEFNKGKDGYIIPKKGSQEYEMVKQIMAGQSAIKHSSIVPSEANPPKPKRGRKKKVVEETQTRIPTEKKMKRTRVQPDQ